MVDPFFRTDAVATSEGRFDAGLRAHMLRVFNYMGIGLALTGGIAFLIANTALSQLVFGTPLKWVAMLAPFGFIMYLNFRLMSMTSSTAKTVFFLFCGAMGLSLASIFLVFTGESIARSFFITAAMFGCMSLWGYTTRKDLTGMGSFMMMGLLGLFVASLVNLFLGAAMLQWIISVATVGIFVGLTAYDTQRIKQMYAENWGTEANDKLAVIGALSLYLDFINVFQALLSLTGGRRD